MPGRDGRRGANRTRIAALDRASSPIALLLWGIAFELAFAAAIIYIPGLRPIFHTAPLGPAELAFLLPFPFVVWGADELRRWRRRLTTSPDHSIEGVTVREGHSEPQSAVRSCPKSDAEPS